MGRQSSQIEPKIKKNGAGGTPKEEQNTKTKKKGVPLTRSLSFKRFWTKNGFQNGPKNTMEIVKINVLKNQS